MTIRGVIFDLDGILIDSFGAITEAYGYAVEKLGVPPMKAEEFRGKIGMPLEDFFAAAVNSDLVSEGVRLFRERYGRIYLEKTTLMKDAKEVVEDLRRRGVSLAVATNKLGRFSRNILEHLGLAGSFAATIGAGDGIPPKPAPNMLFSALKEMGMPKDEAVYVGDTPMDIETGSNAGLAVIAVATGYYTERELRSAGAWAVLPRLSDILGHL